MLIVHTIALKLLKILENHHFIAQTLKNEWNSHTIKKQGVYEGYEMKNEFEMLKPFVHWRK